MGIKVAKFGGSSVADTIQFSKVKEIILSDPSRRYVVVSAPGKRFDQDTKMTDLLLLCHTHLLNHLPWDQLFQVVCDRFSAIAFTLGISQDKLDLQAEYTKIKNAMADGAGADYIASRGEYLNGRLFAAYLDWDFIDAADVIQFDERGRFLAEETNRILKEELLWYISSLNMKTVYMIRASPEPKSIDNKALALVFFKIKLKNYLDAVFMHGLNKALNLIFGSCRVGTI